MNFGKHKGKQVAWVLVEKPDYFHWMSSKNMTSQVEFSFALNLIKILDTKPFSNVKCYGKCKGKNEVTRLSLYKGRYNMPYWFCSECDPYSHGALPGRLSYISTMSQAFSHTDYKHLVKLFAIAKGIPTRKTEKALKAYFGY